MKYFIISGESSGDMHASNLLHHLKTFDSTAEVMGWGGDKMESEGCKIVKHYRELAFMGFTEVLKHLPEILRNFTLCKSQIQEFKPNVVILVDFPGFNLRMAKWLKENAFTVIYYISPQVWAWKESRVDQVRKFVDRMYVILPFEKPFYAQRGIDVEYNGHPLIDEIEKYRFQEKNHASSKKIIAILPGSRKQEVLKILPEMLKVCNHFPEWQFVISAVPHIDVNLYNKMIHAPNIKVQAGQVYSLLSNAHAAIVTSGTATLETALFKVPEVVCFKGSALSFWLAKKLIKVKYISLVNLILDGKAVDELIQNDLNEQNLITSLHKLLDAQHRELLLQQYDELISVLGGNGASEKSAKSIVHFVNH